jgi:hypothetical protein
MTKHHHQDDKFARSTDDKFVRSTEKTRAPGSAKKARPVPEKTMDYNKNIHPDDTESKNQTIKQKEEKSGAEQQVKPKKSPTKSFMHQASKG